MNKFERLKIFFQRLIYFEDNVLLKVLICFLVFAFSLIFYDLFFVKNERNYFIAGMISGWAPFMITNREGNFEGFDIDVIKEVERISGKEIKIVDLGSLSALLHALNQGSIDFAVSGLDITKKRKESFEMVNYTGKKIDHACFVFSSKIKYKDIDIKKYRLRVGVEPSTGMEKVLDEYANIEKIYISSISDMILFLENNKLDALFLEPPIANKIKNKYENFYVVDFYVSDEFKIDGYGIAIKKENEKEIYFIKENINFLKKNGKISEFEKKWKINED